MAIVFGAVKLAPIGHLHHFADHRLLVCEAEFYCSKDKKQHQNIMVM